MKYTKGCGLNIWERFCLNKLMLMKTLVSIVKINDFKNTLDESYIKDMGWKTVLIPDSSCRYLDDSIGNVSRSFFEKSLIYFTYDGDKVFSPIYI